MPAYVAQRGIDDVPHLGHAPFHDVYKVAVIDIIILSSHSTLGIFLQLVLTMTFMVPGVNGSQGWRCTEQKHHSHFYKRVIREHRDKLVQLLRLKSHPPSQVIIFETTVRKQSLKTTKGVFRV